MSKADRAEELFRMGYNCSQSVYAAFAEEFGISIEEAAKKSQSIWSRIRKTSGSVRRCDGDDYGTWRVIWI